MHRLRRNKKRFSSFLKTDKAILILSICIAFVLWFAAKMSYEYETQVKVELNYVLPKGKTFFQAPPSSTIATMKSEGWNLLFNSFRPVSRAAVFQLENQESQIITPSAIQSKISALWGNKYLVRSIDRDLISIQLDSAATTFLPVRLEKDITYASGYMPVDSLRFNPHEIKISGPKKWVNTMRDYPIELKTESNISESFSKKISLKNPLNELIEISPKEIVVSQKVEKYTEGEIVVPIEVISEKDSVTILPRNVFITYRAPLSIFRNITPLDFQVTAELPSQQFDSENNTLALKLKKQPLFSKIIRLNPPTIQYFMLDDTPK